MPKVTEAHRTARRDQILDAAVACFGRNGIHTTTMADVIAAAGLSSGAIYDYFDSKQELALAAVRREGAARVAEIDAAGRDEPISPGAVLRLVDDAFAGRPTASTIVLQLWSEATTSAEFAEIANSAFDELRHAFRGPLLRWARHDQGIGAGAAGAWVDRVGPAFLALMQGLVLQRTVVPDFDRERYLDGVDLLFSAGSGR